MSRNRYSVLSDGKCDQPGDCARWKLLLGERLRCYAIPEKKAILRMGLADGSGLPFQAGASTATFAWPTSLPTGTAGNRKQQVGASGLGWWVITPGLALGCRFN